MYVSLQVNWKQATPRNKKIDICLPTVFPQSGESNNSLETTPESASPIEESPNDLDENGDHATENASIISR